MSFMDQRAVEIAVWGEGIRRLCGIKTQRNEILLAAIATDPNLRDRHVRLISDDDIDGVEGGDLRNGGLNTGDGCSNIGGKRRVAVRAAPIARPALCCGAVLRDPWAELSWLAEGCACVDGLGFVIDGDGEHRFQCEIRPQCAKHQVFGDIEDCAGAADEQRSDNRHNGRCTDKDRDQ